MMLILDLIRDLIYYEIMKLINVIHIVGCWHISIVISYVYSLLKIKPTTLYLMEMFRLQSLQYV